MNNSSRQYPAATKLYQSDIVQKLAAPDPIGIVLRCWHDAEEIPIANALQDPPLRPLERGEVAVSFIINADRREILPESDLKLIDRSLQPGDFVKRSIDDVQSGVVMDLRVKACLEHAISKVPVDGWRSVEDLDTDRQAEIGDCVVYEDWVGQVIELYDENIIEVPSGQLVRLPEFGSRLSVGEKSENILPSPAGGVQDMLGFLFGSNRTTGPQTVVAIKHTVYAIAWLALNQTLDNSVAEDCQRPQRFWYGADLVKLTLVRSRIDFQMRIGERVHLKDSQVLPFTTHGREEEAGGVVTVNSFNVTATDTEVDILWQDGSRETVKSVDVIPYLNPDEYDCWPGDHVYFMDDGRGKAIPGVVQKVNASQRTATVRLGSRVEQVSLLELLLQGASDSVPFHDNEGLGLRRGETVFIHAPGTSNGVEIPRVPMIGELEPWVRSNPYSQSGQLDGWRAELASIGADIATRRSSEVLEEGTMKSIPEIGTLLWLGEVKDLCLDGTVEVLHPEGTLMTYPLERLTKLHDALEQLDDDFFEDGSEGEHHMHGIWDYDFHWDPDGNEECDDYNYEEEQEGITDPESGEQSRTPSASDMSTSPETAQSISPSNDQSVTLEAQPNIELGEKEGIHLEENDNWRNFKMLSSTPPDHVYYHTATVQPSRQFMARMNREYRILMTSLPENILVRAYEDRTDLLRSLIIGPENTPYENAPFVIDWHLVDYPHAAPRAHFHSLTNGNGRVNPNLYEEGKVCLSILNTWSGDRSESWDASRSSLLQALVSIQGLVLIKEPWFCEPAYEKLRGTEEGMVNSRLYSEKAYVLSRGFVRRTLETPFGGLESEIRWLYYSNNLLEKVLSEARAQLIFASNYQSSEETKEDREKFAIPRLSEGGKIALERTLVALQNLLDSHSSKLA